MLQSVKKLVEDLRGPLDDLMRTHFVQGLRTFVQDMVHCDLFKHASAMAYVTLLSIVPSLAAMFSLISIFSPVLGEDSMILTKVKEFVLSNLAAGTGETVIVYIEKLLGNLNVAQMGITGLVGILVSLILLLRQIEGALNRIWHVSKDRNIFTRFIYFSSFLIWGTLIGALVFGVLTDFNMQQFLPFSGGDVEDLKHGFSKFIVPKVAVLIFFSLLYKIVPNTFVSLKHASIGALPATFLFFVASNSYGAFTAKFTNYQAIYGALAAIPLFLMWLYILWLIILFGAVVSWRAQQGFTFKEEVQTEIKLSALEKYRNHQLQMMTPYLALAIICDKFQTAQGEGITGNDVANEGQLPTKWVSEALEVLENQNFILRKLDETTQHTDQLDAKYFPSFPPEKMNLKEVAEQLSKPSLNWVKEWDEDEDQTPEIRHFMQSLAKFGVDPSHFPDINLGNLLDEAAKQGSRA